MLNAEGVTTDDMILDEKRVSHSRSFLSLSLLDSVLASIHSSSHLFFLSLLLLDSVRASIHPSSHPFLPFLLPFPSSFPSSFFPFFLSLPPYPYSILLSVFSITILPSF